MHVSACWIKVFIFWLLKLLQGIERGAKTRVTEAATLERSSIILTLGIRFNRCLLSTVHTKTMLLLVIIRKEAKYLPSEDMSSSIISPLIFPVKDRSTCFMYVGFFLIRVYSSQRILCIKTLNCQAHYGLCSVRAAEIVCYVRVKYLCIPQFFPPIPFSHLPLKTQEPYTTWSLFGGKETHLLKISMLLKAGSVASSEDKQRPVFSFV